MKSVTLTTLLLASSLLAFAEQKKLCGESPHCAGNDHACLAGLKLRFDGPHSGFRGWLNADVRWIISDEERQAFKKLTNDEERDKFIEQFWLLRDPTPKTIENEFEEEHYRRIMYANEHFGTVVPGWRTDRGRIYVMDGPPDEVVIGTQEATDTAGHKSSYPRELWRYKADKRDINFVDTCGCGDYHMTLSREEKDKLLEVPGLALPGEFFPTPGSWVSQPEREIDEIVQLQSSPQPRFKDLEDLLSHHLRISGLPFSLVTASFRITDFSDWVPVTIRYNGKDLRWTVDGNVRRAKVRVFGRVQTLTLRIAKIFEDQIDLTEPITASTGKTYAYSKVLPLHDGLYRLQIAVEDVTADHAGVEALAFRAPGYYDNSHISSIVLGEEAMDLVFHPVATDEVFAPKDFLHLFAQVYGLAIDNGTRQSNANVDYDVFSTSGKAPASVLHLADTTASLEQFGEQLELQKEIPARQWKPGEYDVVVRVRDNVSHQDFCAEQTFSVQ